MKIIFVVLGIILLLLAIVMLLPVKVVIEYSGKTRLKICVYGIKVFDTAKKVPARNPEENKAQDDGDTSDTDYITLLKENFEFLKEILKEIVEKIEFKF